MAARLAIKLGSSPQILGEVSQSSGISQPNSTDGQADLVRASGQLGVFDAGVLILDASGTITAASLRPDLVGQDWSGHPIIAQLSGSKGPVISDVLRDGFNDSPAIEIGITILSVRGEFLGSMIGMFHSKPNSTGVLYGEILRLGIGSGAYIVDGSGKVIYHDDPERVGDDLGSQAPVTQVRRSEAGAIRPRTEGTDVVSAFSPIPGTSWGLVTEESWSALTSGGRNFQRFLLLLLALGIAVPAVLVAVGLSG